MERKQELIQPNDITGRETKAFRPGVQRKVDTLNKVQQHAGEVFSGVETKEEAANRHATQAHPLQGAADEEG